MGKHPYSKREVLFVKNNISKYSWQETTDMLNTKFGTSRTVNQIRSCFIANYGIRRNCPRRQAGRKSEVGSERKNQGYIEVKVAQPSVWKFKHIVIWEAAHGKLPEGYCIMFADKNKLNLNLGNLIAIPKNHKSLINLNGLAYYDPESLKAVSNVLALKAKIRKLRR